jgi:hypothetical protein
MPKVQVFISHSKRDKKYCLSFANACTSVGLDPFVYEFEDIKPPHWKTLQREISKSAVLFLLIGKEFNEIQKSLPPDVWRFTQNWIAYEIGVAAQKGIEVWVLCENTDINFPVPYFTNLYFWEGNPDEQKELFFFLETYSQDKYFKFGEKMRHKCTNRNCRITYNIIQRLEKDVKIKCPSCLEINEFPEGFNVNTKQDIRILKRLAGLRLRDTNL